MKFDRGADVTQNNLFLGRILGVERLVWRAIGRASGVPQA